RESWNTPASPINLKVLAIPTDGTTMPPRALPACLAALTCLALTPNARAGEPPPVAVEIAEGVPDKKSWDFPPPAVTDRFREAAVAFTTLPTKYSAKGIPLDRSSPFLVRASCPVALAAGEYRVILRSRNAARLWL